MNPTSVADSIRLDRIETPAALRQRLNFSAGDAKKIIQEALRLDIWTNHFGEGPETNRLAKLTGFAARIVVTNERRAKRAAGGAPKAAPSSYAKTQRLTPAQRTSLRSIASDTLSMARASVGLDRVVPCAVATKKTTPRR